MRSPPLDRLVLLFYEDFDRDRYLPGDRHIKRWLRAQVKRFTGGQRVTGFYVWHRLLVEALRAQGFEVRVNDRRLARRHPRHPVGITGYPHILKRWSLPNPAVLGPGLFDHPALAPDLMRDERFRYYVVTCAWNRAMFEPFYGAACVDWHAGIPLERWPDTRGVPKDIDVLIYDKIRWERDRLVPELLEPILGALEERGLRVQAMRYGRYDIAEYRTLLQRSRAMVFLCESETQGMAYQEALASNLPVLAWDPGWWVDPNRLRYTTEPVPACSVPYFSAECGETFRGIDDFPAALERFVDGLEGYTPRDYVARELSLERSAELYLRPYRSLIDGQAGTPPRPSA